MEKTLEKKGGSQGAEVPYTCFVLTFDSLPGVRETARVFFDYAEAEKAQNELPPHITSMLQTCPIFAGKYDIHLAR